MLTRRWIAGILVVLAGTLLIVMPAIASGMFPDVPSNHPYIKAIEALASRNIIEGYTNGTFGPSDLVRRQQFAKMIVLTMGYTASERDWCTFPDVEHKPGDPYPFHYVAKAASTGLTTGYTDGTFGPSDPISRQQVVTMVVRAGGAGLATPPAGWVGVLSYSNPTHGANIRKAEFNHLLDGLRNLSYSWNTSVDASRGECAQLLYNLLLIKGGGSTTSTKYVPGPTTTTIARTTTTTLSGSRTGLVTSVVDGDTIHVQLGAVNESVRLIGMDAPEMGEDFSQQAKNTLTGLAGGKTVRLETDVETRDQYGRLLAYVWVGTTMANAELLRQGVAMLYTVPPNVKYTSTLRAAQAEAEAAGRGMWGQSSACPLLIMDVRYDAPGNDNFNLNQEYVVFEVLVSGSLIGYAVEDQSGHRYDFPDRTFQRGQVFKLRTGVGTNTQTDLYWGMTTSAIWNNDGDTVKVLGPQGQIVTSYSY